jgi:hypothetical protein
MCLFYRPSSVSQSLARTHHSRYRWSGKLRATTYKMKSILDLLTLQNSGMGSGHKTLLYGNAILLRHSNSNMVN